MGPAPSSKARWVLISPVSLQGFGELPQHCGQMMIAFFCLALVMCLVRDLVPTKLSIFIPIPMAMAIPFYVGAAVAVDILIGALVKAYWYWTRPLEAPGKASVSLSLMWRDHSQICCALRALKTWSSCTADPMTAERFLCVEAAVTVITSLGAPIKTFCLRYPVHSWD